MNANAKLNIQDLETLLQDLEPEEIRKQEAASLDARGLSFLEDMEKEMNEVRHELAQSGEAFREALPEMPQCRLEEEFFENTASQDKNELSRDDSVPRRRSPRLSNGILALAAALVLAFSLQRIGYPKGAAQGLRHERSSASHVEETRSHYDELFAACMTAGNACFEIGLIEGQEEIYADALDQFLKAYDLRPDDKKVLRALVRTYEKLGLEDKMRQFNEKLETLPN